MSGDVVALDLKNGSETEYHAYYRFWHRLRAELFPDDPVPSFDAAVRSWRNQPAHVVTEAWAIWTQDGSEIVARGQQSYADGAENAHVAEFTIHVLPQFRRQGLGARLMARIAQRAAGM